MATDFEDRIEQGYFRYVGIGGQALCAVLLVLCAIIAFPLYLVGPYLRQGARW